MTLFPAGQNLLGKQASDLVGEDIAVHKDGSVTGTLKNVTGYENFSSNAEEQSGHYFPFKLVKSGTVMTIEKNGVAVPNKENISYDPEIILRVEKSDKFTIKVGTETADETAVTLNFEQADFEGGD